MDLEYKLINTQEALKSYKNEIFALFQHCFEREIEFDLWEWQYLKNPVGNPLVSLCFDGRLLVGHYAAIQLPVIAQGQRLKTLLSVGSMVHNSYRKYGIFVQQGEHLYAAFKNDFLCVMGFPNKMALPARKKRLYWRIDEADFVALVTKKQLLESQEFNAILQAKKDVMLDTTHKEFLQWRLSKPSAHYFQKDASIIKQFSENQDIVYIQGGYEHDLDENQTYYVLCDGSVESLRPYHAFDYPFGYRVLEDANQTLSFKKDLILSDVF